MPDTPLGRELAATVPDLPLSIDATEVLNRARRRARLRTAAVSGTAAVSVVSLAVVLTAFHHTTSSLQPGATTTPHPHDSPSPTATTPTTPDVVGLEVDTALSALQRASCDASLSSIIPGNAPVGVVLAQHSGSGLCAVTLTISAGPRTTAPACSSLTVTAGHAGVATGHSGFPLHFRNNNTAPCTLTGYPTILATDSRSGTTITARQTPNGYLGGTQLPLSTLVLAPGDQVSALLEGTDNPAGNATSCSHLTHLRVIINGHPTPIDGQLSNCSGLEVHPYLPGTTGRT